ncbi:MAG: PDC sensor domain-containing protein [Campylobacterota bacterium]|nr:PDC sensor domain-containing protein [Campylobacterota bacterium]
MLETRDIGKFSEVRTKARAYFCYLFSKNLPHNLPSISIDTVTGRLRKIQGDLKDCEAVYLLDNKGVQLTPTYLNEGERTDDAGMIRAHRAYYYRAMKEKRCSITDPYPSLITGDLSVTVSKPIANENGEIEYVACLDMPLSSVINIGRPTALSNIFSSFSKISYTLFSIALAIVALLLFIKAVQAFFLHGFDVNLIDVKDIFSATILLTLSLAIFDLVKTLFEEEVLGEHHSAKTHTIHKTMVRFLGSIIIALSIETLMLVFKFAMTEPAMILNAVYLVGGVSVLLISLGAYIKLTQQKVDD